MPTHPSHHDPGNGPAGTTRTRLPEGGGYASPRRPPARISRTLVTVVGIVVLLVAALAFATRGGSSGGTSSTPGTGAQAPSAPHAAPTAPTGTRPVTTTTSGIPTGYPHTTQGAQSAAANYAVALGGDGMFRTTTRHGIVGTVYAAQVLSTTQQELDKAYGSTTLSALGLRPDGSAPSGLVFVSRTVPVGTKATSYPSDGRTATVQVWCSSLSGLAGTGSTKPVSESWLTITERLTWTGGDWKISSSSQSDGPAPISSDQQAASAGQIVRAVNGYGGFTYAR